MNLMARVTMGTVRARHQEEAREAVAFREAAAARAEADALADAAAEAARARATQAQAEAAQRAHWANALAEGKARRAAEELHSQRAAQRAEAWLLELTLRERCRLANLRRNDFWGPPRRRGGAGPSGAGGGAGTSGGQ
jgi:membrane protein involved in colicin uptake